MSPSKLDKLLQKRNQLDARIKSENAKLRAQSRKDDTRRKIIIGALTLQHSEMHPDSPFAQELQKLILDHVTKPQDRALLGLPPLDANPDAASAPTDPATPFSRAASA